MGFHKDGLRLETSIRMYKTLVRPILEYAAQVISYRQYYFTERNCKKIEESSEFIEKLEKFQNKVLKKLIPCPKNTPPEILRILTGTMPISGRIDILKLRYHWKLYHGEDSNAAHQIYKGMRANFLEGNVGYTHEIFNLCCKYERMDLWHGRCPDKVNPLSRIRKIVEAFQLKKDMETANKGNCIYRKIARFKDKKYRLEESLREPGRFKNTEHRRVFLYTWLDTAKYERGCKNCGEQVKDMVEHGLKECKKIEKQRKLYTLRMKLYDVPHRAYLLEKREVCEAALA